MNASTSVNLSNRRERLRTQGELGLEASSVEYMPSLGINSQDKSLQGGQQEGLDSASIHDIETMLRLQIASNG